MVKGVQLGRNPVLFLIGGMEMGRVFVNHPKDLRSIPGRVIPKTLRMVLDTS